MKNLLWIVVLSLSIHSCTKEDLISNESDASESKENVNKLKAKKNKVTLCHFDSDNDSWHSITINENALEAHLKHGDVIIDEDGDGYATFNECGLLNENGIDCDDNNADINPGAEEICDDGIDNNCDGQIDEGCIKLTYVPDDNFEQALISMGKDDVLDDYVLTDNISNVTNLSLNDKNISDLTGIEDFAALRYLSCHRNSLTSLDVTSNANLKDLGCTENSITSIDVSSNPLLESFNCGYNQINQLNLSSNPVLRVLRCYLNPLTGLDVSNNPALVALQCSSNGLTSLDVSNNPLLESLECSNNELSALNLTNNIKLTSLSCFTNQLTLLDLSNNIKLGGLNCFSNQLTSLDLSNNPLLSYLYCYSNQLEQLDLKNGNNTRLTRMRVYGNSLLTCIQVDNAIAASTYPNWRKDAGASYSENCGY